VTIGIATRAVYAEGGVRAFFRGNGANVLKVVPETAVKFAAFDLLKRAIATDPGNVTIAERFAAGGLAGVASQALVYPLEVIKTRLAVTPPGSAGGDGIAAMASHVVARAGARADCSEASPRAWWAYFRTPGSTSWRTASSKTRSRGGARARGKNPGWSNSSAAAWRRARPRCCARTR
jgi:hypothetical protein